MVVGEKAGGFLTTGPRSKTSTTTIGPTGMITAALAQTIKLPEGAERRFFPDPNEAAKIDAIAAEAAKHDFYVKPTKDGIGAN